MVNFITNSYREGDPRKPKDLKTRLEELILKSQELKFLVGFFYFSGISELYEPLKKAFQHNNNLSLRILVGLSVDRTNYGIIEFAEAQSSSDDEKIQKFFISIKKSINSKEFDNRQFYEQVRFFIDLIKNNRLVIRKTREDNHAKLYIFKLTEDQVGRRSLFITGSSNLTQAGLKMQNEFNVEISDYGFEEAEKYFDELWDDAVKITEDQDVKPKLISIIEDETFVREIKPFEAYCLVLKTYIESFERVSIGSFINELLIRNGYIPYRYQLDAIKQALSIIEKHNGVIIADVVGLGKTIIACAVARELGKRGVIICPPSLTGDPKIKDSGWNMYKEQFHLYDWEVWSLGELEKLQEYIKNKDDIEVVIVDEAHRFRNEDTKRYESLKNICRNKIVILLTATPFNNKPADILSLLKLFIVPKKSTITLEDNILIKFTAFENDFNKLAYIKKNSEPNKGERYQRSLNYYRSLFGEGDINIEKVKERANYIAKQIRSIIEPVVIRRNRLDLQNNPYYKEEINNFSKVQDPKEEFYELTPEQSAFYDEIIKHYFGDLEDGGKFKGAIYRPFEYEKGKIPKTFEDVGESNDQLNREENREYQQQRNLFNFMRRLLVKRFESSFGAFKKSIENFKNTTKIALEFIQKTNKYILDIDFIEDISYLDIDQIEEELIEYQQKIKDGIYPKKHKVYKIDDFKLKDKFLSDIKADLELFEEILEKLDNLKLVENDPKYEKLVSLVKRILSEEPKSGEPKRKIIIFSEYVDTVKYLAEKFKNENFYNRVLVVDGNLTQTKATQILENFDASYELQKDNFDILLTSDKLSEGFNFNRAGVVINYDIPWNPVRVIQRVGRINRINKKVFDELYIINFFPTEKGADIVKLREIAINKMFLIHNALGEDVKIFDIDEEPSPSKLYQRIQQNPDQLEEESFYTKILKEFYEIEKNYPEIVKKINNFPSRVKTAKKSAKDELLVFYKKNRLFVTAIEYKDGNEFSPYYITIEEAIDKVRCSPEEHSLDWNNEKFWEAYEKAHKFIQDNNIASGNKNSQSLEYSARNIIKKLLREDDQKLGSYKNFLKTLIEDIENYGTLPDYTLRRIANLNINNLDKTIKDLEELKSELGEDYLEKQKAKLKEFDKEIIIAIENRRI